MCPKDEVGRGTFAAMGTTVDVLAPRLCLDEAIDRARQLFSQWESVLSRFRLDSELSRVNRSAGREVSVSELFWCVLEAAFQAAQATDGWFDFAMGRHLQALGYDVSWEAMARTGERGIVAAPLIPRAWELVQLNSDRRTVRVPDGVQLDFGGIAKGMAVDAAVEDLRAAGIVPVMVNAGGDLAVSGVPPEGAWPVAVGRDSEPTVALHYGALATSGTTRRQWIRGGRTYHHLLDPHTGYPSDSPVIRATVWAPTAREAEVLAKVALLRGWQEGAEFLRRMGAAGELEHEDGRIQAVGGWPRRSKG
ncbi:MAG: FAD:protein FMN transferase [Firmicutes bacterium]|nr:FAD:protein FMN transferase [Bacillota bacterium]